MRRLIARWPRAWLLLGNSSYSTPKRRLVVNHAKVRSTIHRCGRGTKPAGMVGGSCPGLTQTPRTPVHHCLTISHVQPNVTRPAAPDSPYHPTDAGAGESGPANR